jgi:sugar lactone lactonase YvrE
MTWRFLQPHNRRRAGAAVGAAAAVAAVAAWSASSTPAASGRPASASGGPAGASAPSAGPVLQTLTYTATGPGGGLKGPAGVSALNGTVYVSNTAANVVATLVNGSTTAIAGSLSAFGEHGDGGQAVNSSLYQPSGTAEDASGDIFIADSGDNAVREVTPAGVIRLIAGSATGGQGHGSQAALDRPEDVAVSAQGDVFIAETYANRVVRVTPSGHVLPFAGNGVAGYAGDQSQATGAKLTAPAGVAVDAQGNVYIADSGNNVIRRVDAKTGIITTVAGNFAADKANDGLGGFSGDGGPATSAQLNDPQGVALDGAGDLFIADTFNNAIREVTPDGTISTVVNSASANGGIPPAGSESNGAAPTASKLNTPYGVAVDQSTGTLYIADTRNSKVAAVTGLAQSGSAAGPTATAGR